MFKKVVCLLLIICILPHVSGCATYQFGRLPSPYIVDHPNPISQNDVSVAVKFFGCSEADTTFDCEICKRKILPIFIAIENKSNEVYHFRKADVDPNYYAAEDVAKKCARSTMGRVLSYGVLGVFIIAWIVFIPMMIAEWINCPRFNAKMRSDYISNEIADTTIVAGRSVSGVMFVAPLNRGEKLNIPLTAHSTGEKLLFEFYY